MDDIIVNYTDFCVFRLEDLKKRWKKLDKNKHELIIDQYDFLSSKNILLVNYLPNGLKKIYNYHIKFISYLPYTLNIIEIIINRNYKNLDKLPYSINTISIDLPTPKICECNLLNLINLNLNELSHIFINNFYSYYINHIKITNYIKYDFYINSYFAIIYSEYFLHLYKC